MTKKGKDPNLNKDAPTKEQSGGKPPRKGKRLLIIIISIVIVLLLLALILTITPLRDLFWESKSIPEISLEVVDGPELDESGKYRFEVTAIVSGNPSPEVIFNRDDSTGKAGIHRVIILLDPDEVFTLTAVATNSQGRKDASLELIAGSKTIAVNDEEKNGEEEAEENGIKTEKLGTIEGHLVYPSAHIPAMTIVAENVDTGYEYITDIIIYDSKYDTGCGFVIQVPPGGYHVYAIKPGDDFKAYYDEYVQSNYVLDSHTKILVTIEEEQHVDDVVVGNWWKVPPI